MLTYTVISDWANDVFSLNPQTGVFTLTARLDYEEVSECRDAKECLHCCAHRQKPTSNFLEKELFVRLIKD
jgi:hypothetical protein